MPKKINIRAVYKDGSLTPLGHVDIAEGDVVSLTIEVESQISKGRARGGDKASCGRVDRTRRPRKNQARAARSSPFHK